MARFTLPQADSANPVRIRSSHWHKYLGDIVKDYILTGLGLSAGAGLNVNVAAGRGYIRGIDFESDAQETVAVVANSTNYIFAQLTFDGELGITGWQFVVNQTGTPPSDSILLGTATTDASSVTSTSSATMQQGLTLKDFAVETIKAPAGNSLNFKVGNNSIITLNSDSTVNAHSRTWNNFVATAPVKVGNYVKLDVDNTSEYAVYTAYTAGGGGTRVNLAGSEIRIGSSVSSYGLRVASNAVELAGQNPSVVFTGDIDQAKWLVSLGAFAFTFKSDNSNATAIDSDNTVYNSRTYRPKVRFDPLGNVIAAAGFASPNIKAKDGTVAITISDVTGAMDFNSRPVINLTLGNSANGGKQEFVNLNAVVGRSDNGHMAVKAGVVTTGSVGLYTRDPANTADIIRLVVNGNAAQGSALIESYESFLLRSQKELRFADSDNSNYVGFKAPATVATNKIWTLPDADGATGHVLTTDGAAGLSFKPLGFAAGDLLWASSDNASSTTSNTFVKVKEILIKKGGTLRIKFSGRVDSFSRTWEGYIARNGVQVGTLRSTNSTTAVEFSEDISGWSPNDLVQIYHRRATGSTGFAETRNFRIYVDVFESFTVNL